MTLLGPSKFDIDSALELVADGWTAEMPDSIVFRSASPADRVTLKSGFLDTSNDPQTIAAIIQGVIDEYEITLTPTNISGRLRGRDPSATILDSYYQRTYTRIPAAVSPNAGYIEQLPTTPANELLENVTVGNISARQIAADACASVGLALNWAVRDYQIQETFQATGRIVDTLRRLVEPWTLVEPFRVDIYLQGSTVFIKHRQLPGQILTPDYTFELADTKRSQVVVRKRRYRKLGTITLRGQKVPDGLATGTTGTAGLVFVAGTETVVLVSEAFNQGGDLVSRTVNTVTYRMPDRIPIHAVKETFAAAPPDDPDLIMTARETIEYDVESSIYDFNGPINQPKIFSQTLKREAIDPDDEIFKVMATEETVYHYDPLNFQDGQTCTKKKFDATAGPGGTGDLVNSELTIETLLDVSALMCERIIEQFNFDSDKKQWVISRRDTALAGGHRPGGPGRGGSIAGLPKGTGADKAFKNVVATLVLSTDADAQNVDYTNENLTLDDLNFILSLFAATPGLFEYEMQFDGVSMPWFRRGTNIKLVNVHAEDGMTDIELPTVIVTSINAAVDESSMKPSFLQRIRAFGIASS